MNQAITAIFDGNILKPDKALELKPNTRYLIQIVSEISQSNNAQPNDYELLERLAGTWTEVDEKEFLKNTEEFNQVDQDLWQSNQSC
jgi:predicted DNA-binding antitoxin AbrB/MazE fold protein